MRSRLLAIIAFLIIAVTFIADAYTPQTLVIANLLDVPIVLAALTQSRRLTASMVALSIAADLGAAAIDVAREGRVDVVGIADRGLTLLSIILVGILCTTLQERAKRVAGLAVRDARARRKAKLASAAEAIRETLSGELVVRAVVCEALTLLDAQSARWYPADGGDVIAAPFGSGAGPMDEPISPEIASLIARTVTEEHILNITGEDAVARLVLDRLQVRNVLSIPVRDRDETLGVLLISRDEPFDEEAVGSAWAYAEIAETALTQARLFDELARRNEELGERQEIIRDLVYALSHDLRTPLSALAVTLRQARDGSYGTFPTEYCEILSASLVSIDDLRRLAETLLLVARIEAGEHRLSPEAVDVTALARDVVAEFDALADSRSIKLTVDGAALFVYADRADLRRAVVNLVANGLQYTGADGTVIVRCSTDGARVRIDVVDDGFGVAVDQVPFLFQRFSGGRNGGGSGLGLYIVRRIAEENGGTALYAPHKPRGSIFTIDIPAVPHGAGLVAESGLR